MANKRWKALTKDVPQSDRDTPEYNAKWQKMYQEFRNSPEHKKQTADYDQARELLKKYVEAGSTGDADPDVAHGYVWLFRRKKEI